MTSKTIVWLCLSMHCKYMYYTLPTYHTHISSVDIICRHASLAIGEITKHNISSLHAKSSNKLDLHSSRVRYSGTLCVSIWSHVLIHHTIGVDVEMVRCVVSLNWVPYAMFHFKIESVMLKVPVIRRGNCFKCIKWSLCARVRLY